MSESTTSLAKDVTVKNDASTSTTVQQSISGAPTTATAELSQRYFYQRVKNLLQRDISALGIHQHEVSFNAHFSENYYRVVTPKSATPTTTSTITEYPESTFSTPVSISVVDPENGKITLTTPAVVTVLSTSTQPDGGYATYTHIIANPSVANDAQIAQTGPYEESHSPQMRSVTQDIGHFLGNSTPIPSGEDARRPSFNSSNGRSHSDIAPLVSHVLSPRRVPVPTVNPFDDPSLAAGLVGYGLGYGLEYNRVLRDRLDTASIAQSSPSIYPASLPPLGDDDNTDATQSPVTEHSFDIPNPKVVPSQAPPRPPRSHLRRSLTKPFEMYPITPPSSVSSHTAPDSPLDATKVVRRKTLLDVRPRQILEPMEDI
ncbi:hypothetical protein H0H92_003105 [Tricholoma furcatifolium]|nr:hypothetical protein H0H92_003105 [Tricholoma furcatifolium]